MSAPAYNTVAWFQVGTTDAEQAKGFYAPSGTSPGRSGPLRGQSG
jgi:hypothetical protein